jgi:hypothetical protein
MRTLRAISTCVVLLLGLTIVLGDGSAFAQEADSAEQDAEEAARRAEVAEGLVDDAVANRDVIELELLGAMANISDLSADLSRVASALDTIATQIVFADTEMTGIEAEIEVRAVDAYMNALATPAMTFVNSDSVEAAMVTGAVVEQIVESDREVVDHLVAQKRQLENLHADQLAKQDEFNVLKAQLDTEIERLTALYEEADSEVADRIRAANEADAVYRAALSSVEAARARDAERERQEERDPPTTTTTPDGPDTTDPPSTTAPPTTAPPTTTGDGGGGGDWDFPPAVERWRDLVSQYFPSNRVEEALKILQCESLGDPEAYNPFSGAAGLFQFLPSTWASTAPQAGFPDADAFDPEANIGTAAWLANRYQALGQYYWQPWSCRRVLN